MNLLLLRGLMRENRHWGDFPERLKRKDNIDEVLCLDLPGIGSNKKHDFPISIKDASDLLRLDFLKSKGDTPWAIVGISLGGMIALEWQNLFPSDFKKAFIINSSTASTALAWERLKPKALGTLIKSLANQDISQRELDILKMVSNSAWHDDEVVERWTAIANEAEMDRKTALKQIFAAIKYTAPKKNSIPCVFISSIADNMVSWKSSQRLAKKYKSPLILHKTAGHELALDAPDWLSDTISKNI